MPEYLLQIIKCQKLKREFHIPLDAIVLLSVGEVNKNKNHKIVIEAIVELKNCWYVVCGGGTLIEECQNISEKMNISGRCIFTGYRNDVSEFYRMADVFVFPSKREGLPVALMEAMITSMPIICTDIRGNRDLIKNGVDGLLIDSAEDSKSIALAVKRIISKEYNCGMIAKNAREKILTSFSLTSTLPKICELYKLFLIKGEIEDK